MEYMSLVLPGLVVICLFGYPIAMTMRQAQVLETVPEDMLVGELKRRAFIRKIRAEANAEVDTTVNQIQR